MTFVIMAAAAVAQAGQAVDRPIATEHVMIDDAGKAWRSADLKRLADHVASVNREIATGRKPMAKPGPPPLALPAPEAPAKKDAGPDLRRPLNYGVAHSLIPKKTAWYGGNVPNVRPVGTGPAAGRIHVTAIGPEASAAVEGWRRDPEFARLEAAMGDRLAVQAFDDPGNPIVAEVGLPAGGKPDVVIQMGTGKVVYRAGANPGAAAIVGEIRKRDPAYNPGNDPSGGAGSPESWRLAAWAGVAAGVLLLLKGGRK